MLEIRYENSRGIIRIAGGSSLPVRILAVEGLGLPGKECNVTSYAEQSGQELIWERDTARVITISCDVESDNVQQEIRRILKILYYPGILTVQSREMMRRINCRCTEADSNERISRKIGKLILQFTCDKPYFTDYAAQTEVIFKRANNIKSTFTFPRVFTIRSSRKTVVNRGDVEAEPVIFIYNSGTSAEPPEKYGIEIENHSTGQSILLERQTSPGETITIDVPGRKVISSVEGDITYSISLDTYLSDFKLRVGTNDIEAVNYNKGEDISVIMTYENQYLEAVY